MSAPGAGKILPPAPRALRPGDRMAANGSRRGRCRVPQRRGFVPMPLDDVS